MSNEYVFREKPFSIDCNLKYTLNPMQVRIDDPGSTEPAISVDLIMGGYFKEQEHQEMVGGFTPTSPFERADKQQQSDEISIKYVISEEQLYVYLHFMTILTAYENFSQGVLHQEIFGGYNVAGLRATDRDKYEDAYT